MTVTNIFSFSISWRLAVANTSADLISTAFNVEESWCMAKALTPCKTEEIIIVYSVKKCQTNTLNYKFN